MDDKLYSAREGLASNISTTVRLLVAIIALTFLLHLLLTIITILREIVNALITVFRIFVLWPARMVINVLWVPVAVIKIAVVVVLWAACSLTRGVRALLNLFGLSDSRRGQAQPGGSDGGGGGNLLEISRQQASMASVQTIGMAGHGGYDWQAYILHSDRPDRGGHNIGIVLVGKDGVGAWQATTLGRNGLVARESLARSSIMAEGESSHTQGGHRTNRSVFSGGSRGHLESF